MSREPLTRAEKRQQDINLIITNHSPELAAQILYHNGLFTSERAALREVERQNGKRS